MTSSSDNSGRGAGSSRKNSGGIASWIEVSGTSQGGKANPFLPGAPDSKSSGVASNNATSLQSARAHSLDHRPSTACSMGHCLDEPVDLVLRPGLGRAHDEGGFGRKAHLRESRPGDETLLDKAGRSE